jgi:hypothetical protein
MFSGKRTNNLRDYGAGTVNEPNEETIRHRGPHFPYNARASDEEREVTAEYEPTDAQRALVENAAAFGLTQADSAEQLKWPVSFLKKNLKERMAANVARSRADLEPWISSNEIWLCAGIDRLPEP